MLIVEEFETGSWPVQSQYADALAAIVDTHSVQLLPVYRANDKFVLPEHVPDAIKGALVEIHFTVKHYTISKGSRHDVFSGIMEQIIIIQTAPPSIPNPYRQKLTKGPYKITPTDIHADQIRAVAAFVPSVNPYPVAASLSSNAAMSPSLEPTAIIDKKIVEPANVEGSTSSSSKLTEPNENAAEKSSTLTNSGSVTACTSSNTGSPLDDNNTENGKSAITSNESNLPLSKRENKRKQDNNISDNGDRIKRRARKD